MPKKNTRNQQSPPPATTPTKKAGTVRLSDIARKAGLSTGAVSSFFNNRIYGKDSNAVIGVSEESRERILKACRELNYRPVSLALQTRIYPEEGDILFLLNESVVDGFNNKFFSLILDGVEQSASGSGIKLSLGRFRSDVDYLFKPEVLPKVAREEGARKFILAGDVNYSLLMLLRQREAWITYVNRVIELDGIISVVPDYFAAARLGVSSLFKAGRAPVAVVAEAYFRGDEYHNRELTRGCAAAFAEHQVAFDPSTIIYKEHGGDEDIGSLMQPLLARRPQPRGVFCYDDWTAHCLYRGLAAAGLSIPDDVSVFGCNDDRTAPYLNPPLTTIHMPTRLIGNRCVEELSLCAKKNRPSGPPRTICFPVDIVLRSSVANLQSV